MRDVLFLTSKQMRSFSRINRNYTNPEKPWSLKVKLILADSSAKISAKSDKNVSAHHVATGK